MHEAMCQPSSRSNGCTRDDGGYDTTSVCSTTTLVASHHWRWHVNRAKQRKHIKQTQHKKKKKTTKTGKHALTQTTCQGISSPHTLHSHSSLSPRALLEELQPRPDDTLPQREAGRPRTAPFNLAGRLTPQLTEGLGRVGAHR